MWHIYIVYTSMAAEQNHIITKSLERYTTVLFHSKEAKWNVLGKVCPPNCAQRKIMRKTMIMPGIKSWTSKQIRYASAFCARYARLGHHKGGQERRNIDTHTHTAISFLPNTSLFLCAVCNLTQKYASHNK